MTLRPRVDDHLAHARDEVAALSAIINERTRELRDVKRRLYDARTRLERLRTQAESALAGVGVH